MHNRDSVQNCPEKLVPTFLLDLRDVSEYLDTKPNAIEDLDVFIKLGSFQEEASGHDFLKEPGQEPNSEQSCEVKVVAVALVEHEVVVYFI